MNKEEINVDIMSSEELEDFEYLIQNYSKSKLAYKIIKIEEENKSYYNTNLELYQENKKLKEIINKIKELMDQDQCVEYCYSDVADYLLELEKSDNDE